MTNQIAQGGFIAVVLLLLLAEIWSCTTLSGAAIHQNIRRRAEHAGFDPTALAKLGGHSLRAGFVTQGTRNGADGSAIARQTGHASLDSVEVYRREHAPLVGNAVIDIGL